MKRAFRLSLFLLIPAFSAVTPLIAIPAITHSYGAAGWEAYGLGLSIGSAACVIVELGWPLTGPQRVAAEGPGTRWVTLVSSIRTRVLMLVLLAPIAGIVAALLALNTGSGHPVAAGMVAVAFAAGGLSGNWYFIGIGQPLRILASDTLPRAALVVAASLAIVAGGPLELVPIGLLIAATCSPIASLLLARHERRHPARLTFRDDLRVMRQQLDAVGGRSVAALYMALPIALVGAFAPAALASFAAVDRLMRMTLTILQAVPNALQNWLGSAQTPAERRHRVLRSIALNATLGVVAGGVFTLATPWASQVLFTGTVQVDWSLAALGGVVLALVCVSRATGPLALVRYQRIRTITLSATAAAIVGVPAICILAVVAGAAGAMIGEILAELTAITVQTSALVAAMRRDE